MQADSKDPEYKDEDTVKVKHAKAKPRKVSPAVIKNLSSLDNYFSSDNSDEKASKIQISYIPSNDLTNKFNGYEAFPTELKDIEIILYGSYFKEPSDINKIIKRLLDKKPELEGLKLSIYDVKEKLDLIEFDQIRYFQALKVLKLNLGLNNIDQKTQDSILQAFEGHPNLIGISLCVNNCDLNEEFLIKMGQKWFNEYKLNEKLKKLKLNLSENAFSFDKQIINEKSIKSLFTSMKCLENVHINLGMNEKINNCFEVFNRCLKESLCKIVTLKVLKLNLYYCKLSHENIEDLCETLCKMNEKLDLTLDLREDADHEIQVKTIKAIEGMISFFRGVANPKRYFVYY